MVRQKIEESVPVQELKTPVFESVKHLGRPILIVLLSFFCIFVGVLIYQLTTPVEDLTLSPKKQTTLIKENAKKSAKSSALFQPHKPVQSILRVENTSSPKIQESVPTPVPQPQEVPPPPEPEVQGDAPVTPSAPPETPVVEPVISKPAEPLLSLENTLQLRDHLAQGQSCLEDLKILMKNNLPNREDKDRLIEKLMPVCTVRSVFQGIEDTFYKNRKKALMTYYRLNNPTWLAYLKTFGSSLVDIRKLNPSKEKPKDMISSAQNALVMKNLSEALQKIQKLPPEIRSEFNDFIGQAQTYLAAQKEVENLILSFGRKGE
ncbi:MAG: hypothetical protein IKS41_02950 [Alphaproteobacteria bacterium]|nr:hypothetical protein [Alphaproteobacteria bacterium]